MKTTVELPTDLLRRLKAQAANEGRSMKVLLTEAIEEKLSRHGRSEGWRTVFGRASPAAVRHVERELVDLERVDLKDWE